MPDGAIDRPRLAALVFQNPERLARLNALVHPPVLRREDEMAAGFFAREPHGIAVVEAAILIETGSYRRYDKLILVFCTPEQQIERALRREGAVEADIRRASTARCRSRKNENTPITSSTRREPKKRP